MKNPGGILLSTPYDEMEDTANKSALAVLRELVRLKDEKDQHGETQYYRANKDKAWEAARRVIGQAAVPKIAT